jgi:hypothetical protein
VLSRLPSAGQLARQVLAADLLACLAAYGLYRWIEAGGIAALRTPESRLWGAIVLAVPVVGLAGFVLQRLVWRSASWEPSLGTAVLAVCATPLFGGSLLRNQLAAEAEAATQVTAGFALPHRTNAGRLGNTKRLSDL